MLTTWRQNTERSKRPGAYLATGSRDKTIKLWNTLGECKFDIKEDGHSEWVSCVRFSPNNMNPVIVSSGWDKVVKVGLLSIRFI